MKVISNGAKVCNSGPWPPRYCLMPFALVAGCGGYVSPLQASVLNAATSNGGNQNSNLTHLYCIFPISLVNTKLDVFQNPLNNSIIKEVLEHVHCMAFAR